MSRDSAKAAVRPRPSSFGHSQKSRSLSGRLPQQHIEDSLGALPLVRRDLHGGCLSSPNAKLSIVCPLPPFETVRPEIGDQKFSIIHTFWSCVPPKIARRRPSGEATPQV